VRLALYIVIGIVTFVFYARLFEHDADEADDFKWMRPLAAFTAGLCWPIFGTLALIHFLTSQAYKLATGVRR
jgi:hypothetical protein